MCIFLGLGLANFFVNSQIINTLSFVVQKINKNYLFIWIKLHLQFQIKCITLNWWFLHNADCVIQPNWSTYQRQSHVYRTLTFSKHFGTIKYNPHNMGKKMEHECVLSHFSHVQLFVTLWTTPLFMGFSRQDYWSGLPCPPLEKIRENLNFSGEPSLLQYF